MNLISKKIFICLTSKRKYCIALLRNLKKIDINNLKCNAEIKIIIPNDKMKSNKNYFSTLDGIRGIAAITILIRHMGEYTHNPFPQSYLAVDLFFLLSGVVVSNAYENRLRLGLSLKDFIKLRLFRIYPLYFLSLIVALIGLYLSQDYPSNSFSVALVAAIFLIPTLFATHLFFLNTVSWSLSAELWGNIVYAVIIKHLSNRTLVAIIIICAIGLMDTIRRTGHHDLDAGFAPTLFRAGYFRFGYSFFCGVLLFRLHLLKYLIISLNVLPVLSWLTVLSASVMLVITPPAWLVPFYDLITVTVIFPVLIFLSLKSKPNRHSVRVFKTLGLLSYPIYILHLPLLLVMGSLSAIRKSANQDLFDYRPALFVGAAVVILAWVAEKLWDTPIRNFLMKKFYMKQSTKTTSRNQI